MQEESYVSVGKYGGVQHRELPLKQTTSGQQTIVTGRLKEDSPFKNRRDLGMVQGQPRIERRDKHTVMHGTDMSGKSFSYLHIVPFHRISGSIL